MAWEIGYNISENFDTENITTEAISMEDLTNSNSRITLPKDSEISQIFSNPLQNTLCLGKKEIEELPVKHLNYILGLGLYSQKEIEYIRQLRRNLKCKAYVKKSRKIQREIETQIETEVGELETIRVKLLEEKCSLENEIEFYKTQETVQL